MNGTNDIATVWADYQVHKRNEAGNKPTAADTLNRCSATGSCLRQRAFGALEIPETHTIESGTLLAFDVGNTIHESLQEAVMWAYPDSEIETPIDLSQLGPSLSGSCDGLIRRSGEPWAILEIKTVSGYGAKIARESGVPKREHVAQAALYALGTDVPNVLIVYVAKEGDFRSGTKPGDMFEWLIGMDDEAVDGWSPRMLAQQELDRFHTVEEAIEDGKLPDALAPEDDGELVLIDAPGPYGKPAKGKYWGCRYCRWRDLCVEVGPTDVYLGDIR